jgi:hypothetical protein
MSNFKLALVELYLPLKHGILDKNNTSMYGNYLIVDQIEPSEFYTNMRGLTSDIEVTRKMYREYLEKLKYEMNITQTHPLIRNYEKIVANPKQFQLQLIEPVTVSIGNNEWDNYSTAVIKTHWIRLIQRRWREITRKRIQTKQNVKNLQYREIHGKWPTECNIKFNLGL